MVFNWKGWLIVCGIIVFLLALMASTKWVGKIFFGLLLILLIWYVVVPALWLELP